MSPDAIAYQKQERKEARKFWASIVIAVAAIAIGTAAFAYGVHNGTEITQIQHSACSADPGSIECQKIKAESDEQQPVVFACIPIRKVAKDKRLLALTTCKKAAERAEANSGSKGVVDTNGQAPSSQPAPHTGGIGDGQEHSGQSNPSTPESPAVSTPSRPEKPTAPPPAEEPNLQPESSSPQAPPVSETANAAPIGEAVESVKEAVCTVNAPGVRVCIH